LYLVTFSHHTPLLILLFRTHNILSTTTTSNKYIKNPDFKYVRILGAFYLRLVGRPVDIYKYLELLYSDYRKVRHRTNQGYTSGYLHIYFFMDVYVCVFVYIST